MPIPTSVADRPGALLVIAARTGQELARRRLAPLGLSVQMCGVLNFLAASPTSQHELGEQLAIDRTTVVELIDQLEKLGVVVRHRNPSDRRPQPLVPPPQGGPSPKHPLRPSPPPPHTSFRPL